MAGNEALVIRISGDSGDGMQLIGEQLTITAALTGKDVRTLPDFPAEIRAPAGTVAGVSGFQLAMAEQAIFTAGETLDVLVAMNPAALKQSLPALKTGGLLIINEESFTDKDWKKAGVDSEFLAERQENYQLLAVNLVSQTLEAVKRFDLSQTQAKKSKNFYVLGLILWLFDFSTEPCREFLKRKFARNLELEAANNAALMAGYNYALTLELSRKDFMMGRVERPAGQYRQITGVEAISLAAAAISSSCRTPMLVSGYPITPASAILHECAHLASFGLRLFQAEDEIAALCACLGAAFGGQLAMTCTSGPGMDLKSEALGLATVTELPLVLIDVQRAGASTGLPTKTSQSDLNQAMYGRHGEAPVPVLAASSPADCFNTLIEAFQIAVNYMTPVILLMDAFLANAAEPWKIPDLNDIRFPEINYNRNNEPFARDENLARSWNLPGSKDHIYQLGGLEKSGLMGKVSYDADNHQQMVNLRAEKINGIAKSYPALSLEGRADAETLVIGWGSSYGALKSACENINREQGAIAHLQLKHLNPLPLELKDILKSYSKVIVAELNSGQLWRRIRADYLVDAALISQCNGQPFTVSRLVESLKKEMNDECCI